MWPCLAASPVCQLCLPKLTLESCVATHTHTHTNKIYNLLIYQISVFSFIVLVPVVPFVVRTMVSASMDSLAPGKPPGFSSHVRPLPQWFRLKDRHQDPPPWRDFSGGLFWQTFGREGHFLVFGFLGPPVPSGKRLHNDGKIHHFSWVNPL